MKIKNINNTSYVIATMYNLSQINEISEYFFSNKKSNILDNPPLFYYFKDYIDPLWKNNENDYVFLSMYFMKQLNKYILK